MLLCQPKHVPHLQALKTASALVDTAHALRPYRGRRCRLKAGAALLLVGAALAGVWQVPAVRLPLVAAATRLHVWLQQIPGFLESLSLIFMVELGDKTFFIAALLAMRFGKLLSFAGSVLSLGFMTVISVIIGTALGKVPQFVNSSLPIGQYLGAALLFFFGARRPHRAMHSATPAITVNGPNVDLAYSSLCHA